MILNDPQKHNAVIRSLSDIPAQKRRKLLLGRVLVKAFSGRGRKLIANSAIRSMGPFDRLLRNGLLAEAYKEGDHQTHRALFSNYWSQEAEHDDQVWQDRFEEEFLGHNVAIVDAIEETAAAMGMNQLYEIGCGHGQVLKYLANRLVGIKEFVGIDISDELIKKNSRVYTDSRISFCAADATRWVLEEAKAGSVFLTNGGVFEYFLESELDMMFKHIAENLQPAIVGVVETIGSDHNLDTEFKSLIYGRELAFSHNYPHLLKKAGFEIVHQSEQTGTESHGGGRWIRVVGRVK